ncbi:P1 family peptidase [Sporosarcina oncorhynchi]|uniref:P1 family peptidase n=1 Tax=Sporosarcina oncorhynchi TaxID=3056444 RepID=A0ABZ0L3E2_9BACL|nr:P1 family peptidase [Sporosarcina sp. T2O-4]WOV87129.1 P1 family peptidase [Sporosarcina sp. T2O-4]
MKKGKWNSITDVNGVKVGHVTLHEQSSSTSACTGVTAILPHEGNLFEQKVPAASFVLNGFGKTAGLIQVEELGVIESPIMLTNTFSVGAVLEGTLQYILDSNPAIGDSTSSLNIVVGECNDSYLNAMREMKVRPTHALEALRSAESGPIAQGAIGAGKGMICYGRKGGIGSASRVIEGDEAATVGVLTLTNFGDEKECLINEWLKRNGYSCDSKSEQTTTDFEDKPDGSVMIIVATDAPVNERQLKRLAKRAAIGLGRTGTSLHNGSGDIIIAFSNAYTIPHANELSTVTQTILRDDAPLMNKLFQATIEATEEAVYQSLIHAETTTGRKNRTVERWPVKLREDNPKS